MKVVPIVETAGASPIELSAAKDFCDAQFDDDDAKFADAIATAFGWLQPPTGVLAHSIAEQTLCVDLPCWPVLAGYGVKLPAGPVRTITHVKYFDENNAEQTLSASNYFADRDTLMFKDTFAAPALYTRPSAVRITYAAGYTTLPAALNMAMLRIIKQLYDFRDELVANAPFDPEAFGVADLIMPFRLR